VSKRAYREKRREPRYLRFTGNRSFGWTARKLEQGGWNGDEPVAVGSGSDDR